MSAHPNRVYDLPLGIWIFLSAVVLAAAMAAGALFPRYDYRLIGEDGHAMMIYDRWTGQFQRAEYSATGEPALKGVLRPF
jgi:hypothetical protein